MKLLVQITFVALTGLVLFALLAALLGVRVSRERADVMVWAPVSTPLGKLFTRVAGGRSGQVLNLTTAAREALAHSRELALSGSRRQMTPDHLLLALLQDDEGSWTDTSTLLSLDTEALRTQLDVALGVREDASRASAAQVPLSDDLLEILRVSARPNRREQADKSEIGRGNLLIALARTQGNKLAESLEGSLTPEFEAALLGVFEREKAAAFVPADHVFLRARLPWAK